MRLSEPLFDIHCHILPGLDDGPADWTEAVEMARCAVTDGIGGIVATPHQFDAYMANTPDGIRRKARELQQHLTADGIAVQVFPGAEVRLEPDLARRVCRGEAMTLAGQGRHVLIELPHEIYVPWDDTVKELRREGLVPIFAHPERNRGVQRQPEVLKSLMAHGCLLQVTAGSLLGKFGTGIRQLSEQLIRGGMAHFVATDGHGLRGRRPVLAAAYRQIAETCGEATASRLCRDNPSQIISGGDALPTKAATSRSFGISWFPWRKAV